MLLLSPEFVTASRPLPKPSRISSLLIVLAVLMGVPIASAVAGRHSPAGSAVKKQGISKPHHVPLSRKSPVAQSRRAVAKLLEQSEVDQIPPRIISALKAAQHTINVDPFVLLAIAWKESRFDSKARNKHSSARGLLQFTTVTWLTVVRDFGARHGLADYARAIHTDQDGRLSVTRPRLRRAILALRDSPDLQAILAAERLSHERGALEAHIRRATVPADLYVLHLLGPSGAKSFLTRLAEKPETSSIAAVGDIASINEGLFVRNGRTLTVAEAYADIQATLTEQAQLHSALFAPT